MKYLFSLLIPLILLTTGCGTTMLIVNHPDVDIYVNNVKKGTEVVQITRSGFPAGKNITAKYKGEVVGRLRIHRSIDLSTIVAGFCTYGIGFFCYWRFPSDVIIPVSIAPTIKKGEPLPRRSVWMEPPKFMK